jgi:hypothetical protein
VLHALEKCLILARHTAAIFCNTAYTGSINNISVDINSGFLPVGVTLQVIIICTLVLSAIRFGILTLL